MSLFADVLALKSALTATPFDGRAAFDAFVKVMYDVIGPVPVASAEGENPKACLEECIACCHKMCGEADTVGKIGDGKILAFIIKVLPLVISLL